MVEVGDEVDVMLGEAMGGVFVAVVVGGIEGEVGPLDAEREGEDEGGEDFAGAAGGEPAVDPGEDHAGEEDVGRGKDGEGDERIEPEGGECDADADCYGEGHEGADDVGGGEKTEEEADGDEGVGAEREADELGGVECGAGLAELDVEELAEDEDSPEEHENFV